MQNLGSSFSVAAIDRVLAEYSTRYAPIISVREAAQIAHCCVQTVYEWSSRGLLEKCRARRHGRLLLHRDAFVKFVLGLEG